MKKGADFPEEILSKLGKYVGNAFVFVVTSSTFMRINGNFSSHSPVLGQGIWEKWKYLF